MTRTERIHSLRCGNRSVSKQIGFITMNDLNQQSNVDDSSSSIHHLVGDTGGDSMTIDLGTWTRAAAAAAAAGEEVLTARRRMLRDLRQAMMATNTTTVTDLIVVFGSSRNINNQPQPPIILDQADIFVQFLLQYISSSETTNHQLRKLTLQDAHLLEFGGGNVAVGVVEALLMAVVTDGEKHHGTTSGIQHVCLSEVVGFPVQGLVNFCQSAARNSNNNAVKVLELNRVVFVHQQTTPPSIRRNLHAVSGLEQSSSKKKATSLLLLDTLILNTVLFLEPREALQFADVLVPRCLKPRALQLGLVDCRFPHGERIAKRVLSQVATMIPRRVKRLQLLGGCTLETFRTALLVAGKAAVVEDLSVEFDNLGDGGARFDAVANLLLCGSTKLTVLHIASSVPVEIQPQAKINFFRAVEALAGLAEIHISNVTSGGINNNNGGGTILFSQQEAQWLQGRAERNRNLRRFVVNPRNFPERELLILMLRLENCPMGRLQLARALPVELFKSLKNQVNGDGGLSST